MDGHISRGSHQYRSRPVDDRNREGNRRCLSQLIGGCIGHLMNADRENRSGDVGGSHRHTGAIDGHRLYPGHRSIALGFRGDHLGRPWSRCEYREVIVQHNHGETLDGLVSSGVGSGVGHRRRSNSKSRRRFKSTDQAHNPTTVRCNRKHPVE